MCSIANADKPRLVPRLKAIDFDSEQADVVPTLQFMEAPAQIRKQPCQLLTKAFNSASLDLLSGALGNDKGALPVLITVDHHQDSPTVDAAERLLRIALLSRNPHPEHIHRGAFIKDLQACFLPHDGMPAVGAHH